MRLSTNDTQIKLRGPGPDMVKTRWTNERYYRKKIKQLRKATIRAYKNRLSDPKFDDAIIIQKQKEKHVLSIRLRNILMYKRIKIIIGKIILKNKDCLNHYEMSK